VVAVDLFLTESSRHADVVLAAAGPGEKSGTTTNVEGRVSVLNQKVTPPGTARADWIIAAELAARLGHDIGFGSLDELWAEVERVAPAHAGLTREVLLSHRDGVVVPCDPAALEEQAGEATLRPVEAVEVRAAAAQSQVASSDIQAVPGPEAVPAGPTGGPAEGEGEADETAPSAEARPPLLSWRPGTVSEPPRPDAYAVRLVTSRKLYDAGTLVQHCPSLAALALETRLRVNPHDLSRLGLTTGDRAKVSSARASATVAVEADDGIPRGSASLTFNEPGDVEAANLIDATAPVTELRVETL
jgi:predicted molibdopterin-dependent oxidoreductase YjgC